MRYECTALDGFNMGSMDDMEDGYMHWEER